MQPLVDVAVSPQGSYVGLITQSGKLALWSGDLGRSIWSEPGISEHNVAVSDEMGYAIVYDQMNRIDRSICLYRGSGQQPSSDEAVTPRPRRILRTVLDGAVWSTAVSFDGSYAACGTGSRQVCLFSLGPKPRVSAYPIDGICNDIAFARNNQYVAIGLWNQSGVETMDMSGRLLWNYLAANDRRYMVSISPDSQHVLAVSYFNPQWSEPIITLFENGGGVRWSHWLGANTSEPTIALGANSTISFASFTQTVHLGQNMVPERTLIALGPDGDVNWVHRGGVFFSLELICLTPDGTGIVAYDGNRTLYRLNSDGQVTAHYKLPAALQYWASTYDHKHLLIYTTDSELTMLSVR